MTTNSQQHDLVISRVFDAPIEQVWQAWVDPAAVRQWWGPLGFSAPVAEMDFRVGGTSLVCMSSPEFGEHYSTWHYQAIVPLERIEYIHNLADKDGQAVDPTALGMPPDFPQNQRHVVDFSALNAHQTTLTITEYGWTVGQMMELSRLGMEQCLDKMAVLLAQG